MLPKKEDPLIEALALNDSGQAIINQESRGQRNLVESEVLPKKIQFGTKEQFEAMGVIFGEDMDDLFVYVTLPVGWKKEPTDHSMWSKLVDNKGRKRASIFYKAAFYDRDAFMCIDRRFEVSSFETTDKDGNPMSYEEATNFATCIMDCDKPIKIIAIRSREYGQELHVEEAFEWLNKHYPNNNDPLDYWD